MRSVPMPRVLVHAFVVAAAAASLLGGCPGGNTGSESGTDALPGADSAPGVDSSVMGTDSTPGVDSSVMGTDSTTGVDSGPPMCLPGSDCTGVTCMNGNVCCNGVCCEAGQECCVGVPFVCPTCGGGGAAGCPVG